MANPVQAARAELHRQLTALGEPHLEAAYRNIFRRFEEVYPKNGPRSYGQAAVTANSARALGKVVDSLHPEQGSYAEFIGAFLWYVAGTGHEAGDSVHWMLDEIEKVHPELSALVR